MKKKKLTLTIFAIALICAISVAGTLAYLSYATEAVTNTFVAASGLVKTLTLDESQAVLDEDTGLYTLNTATRVDSNTYTVLPGTTLPKDPVVHVDDKTAVPSYLYIEVVDKTNGAIGWDIDSTNWEALDSVDAPHNGKIYLYKGTLSTGDTDINVLSNNKITVSEDNTKYSALGTGQTIEFYAYMAQATIDNVTGAAAVFDLCF